MLRGQKVVTFLVGLRYDRVTAPLITVWRRIGQLPDRFQPHEYDNFFGNSGYVEPDRIPL